MESGDNNGMVLGFDVRFKWDRICKVLVIEKVFNKY